MGERIEGELIALLPRMRRFAWTLTGSHSDADDLVQSAFEKALRSSHQWTPGTRLDSWFYCVIRSVRIDQLRKRTEVAMDDEQLANNGQSVDGVTVAETRLMLEAVRRSFASLSEDQREVLHLVCVEQMSYRETAEVLGVPIGTVMSRLSRARLALHEKFSQGAAASDVPGAQERATKR
jgi:RNA polymerase sigma-70 factor (ECF subfamily)